MDVTVPRRSTTPNAIQEYFNVRFQIDEMERAESDINP